MSPIQLITFDMTGTLLKFRTPVLQQYAKAAKSFGVSTNPDSLQNNFKQTWRQLAQEHPNFGRGSIQWHNWWRALVIDTLQGTNGNAMQKKEIAEYLIKHFETEEAWMVADNGHEVLTQLKKQHKNIGVISNFDPRLHKIIENLNLKRYFSFVLTSYETGVMKPNREIFDKALKQCFVQPHEAVHIGNDKMLDFDAAQKAGWHSILITEDPKIQNEVENLDHVLKCLNDLSK